MEVTIHNAFYIVIKLSLGPYFKTSKAIATAFEKWTYDLIIFMLNWPKISTIVFLLIFILASIVILISFLVFTLVLCSVISIILFEGYAVLLVLILAYVIILIGCIILTILFGISHFWNPKCEDV